MKLRRHMAGPLLEPCGDDWQSLEVFNPAAIYHEGQIHLLYRATGEYVRYISRLGHAIFDKDLRLLKRFESPCFSPDTTLWEQSVEDARLTPIEGRIYMTYVITPTPAPPYAVRRRLGVPLAPQAHTRISLAEVSFESGRAGFKRLGIITPYGANERDTVLFPERIGGRFASLHRPSTWVGEGYPTQTPGIWFAYLDGLPGQMFGHRLVMKSEQPWEARKIGAGPPPIKTKEGWLLIYHGVDENRVYRAGAALLDPGEPWKVIARSPQPILEPEEPHERIGDVPNVVFPEGAVLIDDELLIFYGGADTVCCAASVRIQELIDYLLEPR